MKINSLEIENCKSYKNTTPLNYDNSFNILVGPNGGGKSNTLDIITILLRNYFLPAYRINERNQGGRRLLRINQDNSFGNIQQFLEKHSSLEDGENNFVIEFSIEEEDLINIRSIYENRAELKLELDKYENTPLNNPDLIDNWDIDELENTETITYEINNWQLDNPRQQNVKKWFYEYLKYLPLFLMITRDNKEFNLNPNFLYFSPYRGASPEDLQANLSSNNYYNLLSQYHSKTSQNVTSLIRLASLYFANKMRKFESAAESKGYAEKWSNDKEVKLVSRYMEKLGYDWDLQLIDENRNIYEIVLSRNGRTFNISQASSGEKEILNFLLGVFAFQIKGGIIIVDEPELHLHPKWQALLRDLFLELSESTNNQFIISTHSPVFLTPKTLPNIRRLSKGSDESTQINSLNEDDIESRKDLLHIVNSHNNERMFFADHVVLVEGIHDRLVFEKLINHLRDKFDIKSIFEVLEVYGKGNFNKYKEFLDGFGVSVSVIGDLDYLRNIRGEELGDLFVTNWKKIDDSVLKSKKSKDRETIAEFLEQAINEDNNDDLKKCWEYVKGRKTKLKDSLTAKEEDLINQTISDLYSSNIYVLSEGEIEDYLPKEYRSLSKTVELVKQENFEDWIKSRNHDEYLKEICAIVLDILNIEKDKWLEFDSQPPRVAVEESAS